MKIPDICRCILLAVLVSIILTPVVIATCEDKDLGFDIWTSGEVETLYGDVSDVCGFGSSLVYDIVSQCRGENCFLHETVCDESAEFKYRKDAVRCPGSCDQGRCVPINSGDQDIYVTTSMFVVDESPNGILGSIEISTNEDIENPIVIVLLDGNPFYAMTANFVDGIYSHDFLLPWNWLNGVVKGNHRLSLAITNVPEVDPLHAGVIWYLIPNTEQSIHLDDRVDDYQSLLSPVKVVANKDEVVVSMRVVSDKLSSKILNVSMEGFPGISISDRTEPLQAGSTHIIPIQFKVPIKDITVSDWVVVKGNVKLTYLNQVLESWPIMISIAPDGSQFGSVVLWEDAEGIHATTGALINKPTVVLRGDVHQRLMEPLKMSSTGPGQWTGSLSHHKYSPRNWIAADFDFSPSDVERHTVQFESMAGISKRVDLVAMDYSSEHHSIELMIGNMGDIWLQDMTYDITLKDEKNDFHRFEHFRVPLPGTSTLTSHIDLRSVYDRRREVSTDVIVEVVNGNDTDLSNNVQPITLTKLPLCIDVDGQDILEKSYAMDKHTILTDSCHDTERDAEVDFCKGEKCGVHEGICRDTSATYLFMHCNSCIKGSCRMIVDGDVEDEIDHEMATEEKLSAEHASEQNIDEKEELNRSDSSHFGYEISFDKQSYSAGDTVLVEVHTDGVYQTKVIDGFGRGVVSRKDSGRHRLELPEEVIGPLYVHVSINESFTTVPLPGLFTYSSSDDASRVAVEINPGWNFVYAAGMITQFEGSTVQGLSASVVDDQGEPVSIREVVDDLGDSILEFMSKRGFWVHSPSKGVLYYKVLQPDKFNLPSKADVYLFGSFQLENPALRSSIESCNDGRIVYWDSVAQVWRDVSAHSGLAQGLHQGQLGRGMYYDVPENCISEVEE